MAYICTHFRRTAVFIQRWWRNATKWLHFTQNFVTRSFYSLERTACIKELKRLDALRRGQKGSKGKALPKAAGSKDKKIAVKAVGLGMMGVASGKMRQAAAEDPRLTENMMVPERRAEFVSEWLRWRRWLHLRSDDALARERYLKKYEEFMNDKRARRFLNLRVDAENSQPPLRENPQSYIPSAEECASFTALCIDLEAAERRAAEREEFGNSEKNTVNSGAGVVLPQAPENPYCPIGRVTEAIRGHVHNKVPKPSSLVENANAENPANSKRGTGGNLGKGVVVLPPPLSLQPELTLWTNSEDIGEASIAKFTAWIDTTTAPSTSSIPLTRAQKHLLPRNSLPGL